MSTNGDVLRLSLLLLVTVLASWSVAETNYSADDEVLDSSFYGLEDDRDRDAGEVPATVLRPAMRSDLSPYRGRWHHRGPYYGHRHYGGPYGCRGGFGRRGYGYGRYGTPDRHRRSLPDIEQRLTRLCSRLQSEPSDSVHHARRGPMAWRLRRLDNETRQRMEDVWRRRRSEMLRCCNLESSEQKTRCVSEVDAARFERVCNGEEPACVWSLIARSTGQRTDQQQSNLTTRCCALQGEDRSTCFREAMAEYRRTRFSRMMDRLPEIKHGEGLVTVTGHGSFTVETDGAAEQEVLDGNFYGVRDAMSEVHVSTEGILPAVPGQRSPQGELTVPRHGRHWPAGRHRHRGGRGPRFHHGHHHFEVHGDPRHVDAVRDLHHGSFPMPDIRRMLPDLTVEGRLARLCSSLQSDPPASDARPESTAWRLRRLDNETRQQIENIWRRRRNEILRCCNLTTSEEKAVCVNETQAARYDRVCNGEEPMCVWSLMARRSSTTSAHPQYPNLTTRCCLVQGEERYACFTEGIATYRMMRHGRGMGGPPSEIHRPPSSLRSARRTAGRTNYGNGRSRTYRRRRRGRGD